MELQEIYRFFQETPPAYLTSEAGTAYVVSILLKGDSYGTELLQCLEREYPCYRISDTILYQTLQFLESEGWIKHYWKRVEGRGRPRRMLSLNPDIKDEAQRLAQMWQVYARFK